MFRNTKEIAVNVFAAVLETAINEGYKIDADHLLEIALAAADAVLPRHHTSISRYNTWTHETPTGWDSKTLIKAQVSMCDKEEYNDAKGNAEDSVNALVDEICLNANDIAGDKAYEHDIDLNIISELKKSSEKSVKTHLRDITGAFDDAFPADITVLSDARPLIMAFERVVKGTVYVR